ncbi:general substrate transporter [Aspergillus insuetus]
MPRSPSPTGRIPFTAHAIDDDKLYYNIYRVASLASVGASIVGYDCGVVSMIVGERRWIDLMKLADTWAATDIFSVYNLGAIIGALCAGHLADRYGREMVFKVPSLVCAVGTVIQLSSFTLPQWIVGHVVLALGIGACVTGMPIYISEIAPRTHQGRVMAMRQLAYHAGSQLGFWLGYFIRHSPSAHPHWWRLGLAPELLLAFVLGFECYNFAPPSPRWLVAKGRDNHALEVLRLLHGEDLAK